VLETLSFRQPKKNTGGEMIPSKTGKRPTLTAISQDNNPGVLSFWSEYYDIILNLLYN